MPTKAIVTYDTDYVATVLANNQRLDPRFVLMKEIKDKNKNTVYKSYDKYDATFCKESFLTDFLKTRDSWKMEKTCVGVVLPANKTQKDIKRVKLLYKKAIQIINMLESRHGWSSTKLELFTRSQLQITGNTASKEEHEGRNSTFVLGVFKPSSVWYQYNHTLSLFLSLIRLSLNGVYRNVASYTRFINRNEELRRQASAAFQKNKSMKTLSREMPHITYANVWPVYLKYMNKIYTSTEINRFKKGGESFIVGIDTFIGKFWHEAIRVKKLDELKAKGLGAKTPKFSSEKDIVAFSCPDKSKAAKRLLDFVTEK